MKVAVVGAGLMGAQIGAEYALGGHDVALVTRSGASARASVDRARTALAELVEERLADRESAARAGERLTPSTDLAAACRGADVVVESVTEALEPKVEVLRAAAGAAPSAILASNTSSISISELGEAAGCGDRLLGTHYWNPPTLMPLVELIPGKATERAIVERMTALLRALGKEPVVVGDVTGFVWNRLQFALLREAATLVAEGVVEPQTVDVIVKRGLGRRWSLIGPFETMALGGADTFARVAGILFPLLSSARDPKVLRSVRLPDRATLGDLARKRDVALARLRREDLKRDDA